jgi:prepilin-type N-terminal cleavage/methylation domain-containing protein
MDNKFFKKGFTLVEILVSLAIFGVIFSVASGTLYNIYRDWTRQRDYMEVMQDAYWALEFMTTELRQATSITNKAPGADFFIFVSSVRRLEVETPYTGNHIWYWRGDRAPFNTSNENTAMGYNGYLYRGETSLLSTIFPACRLSYEMRRQILSRHIVDNPGAAFFYSVTGNLVTLRLTLRPNPDNTTKPGNRDYEVMTRFRRRN